jgi:hypothetical protein
LSSANDLLAYHARMKPRTIVFVISCFVAKVERPLHLEDGAWKMTVDAVELTRAR